MFPFLFSSHIHDLDHLQRPPIPACPSIMLIAFRQIIMPPFFFFFHHTHCDEQPPSTVRKEKRGKGNEELATTRTHNTNTRCHVPQQKDFSPQPSHDAIFTHAWRRDPRDYKDSMKHSRCVSTSTQTRLPINAPRHWWRSRSNLNLLSVARSSLP